MAEYRSPPPPLRGESRYSFMFHFYVLKSKKDGKLYLGSTGNLERRLEEHASGRVKSTENRRPLELVYREACVTKKEAQSREGYFKGGGKARNLLKQLINE